MYRVSIVNVRERSTPWSRSETSPLCGDAGRDPLQLRASPRQVEPDVALARGPLPNASPVTCQSP